jgi:uncharacterized membrane protein YdjX (TVP38/TMEM64 family)
VNRVTNAAVQPASDSAPHTRRVLILIFIFAAALSVAYFRWFTETGQTLFTRENAMAWTREHWVIAPLVVMALFITLSILSLPSWWLQYLCGVCFGLWYGGFVALMGNTLAAGITTWFARWSAGDFFDVRIQSRMAKLRKFEAIVDRNALAAVLILRITPFIPFGIANYMLGLFRVPISTVMIGTFIGAIPRLLFWVQWGISDPMDNPPVFWTIIALNALALSTIPLRYLKPQWFRKMGIE